jgi:hypothetical protein
LTLMAHSKIPQVWYLIDSVSGGLGIRWWFWYHTGSESDRFGIILFWNKIGSQSDKFRI